MTWHEELQQNFERALTLSRKQLRTNHNCDQDFHHAGPSSKQLPSDNSITAEEQDATDLHLLLPVISHISRMFLYLTLKRAYNHRYAMTIMDPATSAIFASSLAWSCDSRHIQAIKSLYTPRTYFYNIELSKKLNRECPPEFPMYVLSQFGQIHKAVGWDLANMMSYDVGACTDVGIRKSVNEDKWVSVDLRNVVKVYYETNGKGQYLFGKAKSFDLFKVADPVQCVAWGGKCDFSLLYNLLNEHTIPFYVAGVFDGHNGDQASEYVESHFVPLLLSHPDFWKLDFKTAILEVFEYMDSCMRLAELVPSQDLDHCTNAVSPGTTAAVVLILGPKLVSANLGDGRVILSSAHEEVPLSNDHKSTNLCEQWRLKETGGGTFKNDYLNGDIAVSRALGDTKSDTGEKLRGLIAIPDIIEVVIHPEDEFLLLACDGIFDVLSNKQALDIIRTYLRKNLPGSLVDFHGASMALVEAAKNKASTDNLTALIVGANFRGLAKNGL